MKNFIQIANGYAEQVVSGEISACQYVVKAARRHLDDLTKSKAKSAEFSFEEAPAIRVCKFIEYMPYTKGRWAAKGGTIDLQPWQVFNTCAVFGWHRGNKRRFRIAYLEIPRKNGKSEWSAAIGNYMLLLDGIRENGEIIAEHGAEVYAGATTEKQAKIIFDAAKTMARRNPDFKKLGVEVMASNLSIPERNCKFEPVIGKPGDGASPSCAIVDEFHEHDSDELYDTMLTGMGAREQPLMWVITTAGSNIAGPCYSLRTDVVKMLDGVVPNDELWGNIYTIDEGDDWTSDFALRKANPNYDVSVSGDFLKSQIREAVNSARKQNIIKTKHLNVWVSSRSAWMNMEAWNACASSLTEEDFIGEPCWVGLDLASKVDLTSVVKIFRRGEDYYLFGRHYVPEAQLEAVGKEHYQGWVYDGFLHATDGDIIDYDQIRADLEEDARKFEIVALGYDPYGSTQLATSLSEAGINAVEVRQTVMQLSEPMKWVEALALAGKLHHDNNPCMNWMVSNVTARVDANDNVFPRKEHVDNKIDGAVAAIIAMAMTQAEEQAVSVYDTRGILAL